MKRQGSATAPVAPADAPSWFQPYSSDNEAVIRALLREIEALKKRLAAAGIA